MTGYDEVKIMMTSLPVPDDFTFSGIPRLVRMYILFFLISNDYLRQLKVINRSLPVERKGFNSKTNRVNPI